VLPRTESGVVVVSVLNSLVDGVVVEVVSAHSYLIIINN
jgi:hypothetical protein